MSRFFNETIAQGVTASIEGRPIPCGCGQTHNPDVSISKDMREDLNRMAASVEPDGFYLVADWEDGASDILPGHEYSTYGDAVAALRWNVAHFEEEGTVVRLSIGVGYRMITGY